MTTATTQSIAELDAQLNQMVLAGQALDAFERFYAEDCVMKESGMDPFVGKDLNREREREFYGNVDEVREVRLEHAALEGNVSYSLWHYDYTHAEWGEQKFAQIAVRTWRDGCVAEESFFRG